MAVPAPTAKSPRAPRGEWRAQRGSGELDKRQEGARRVNGVTLGQGNDRVAGPGGPNARWYTLSLTAAGCGDAKGSSTSTSGCPRTMVRRPQRRCSRNGQRGSAAVRDDLLEDDGTSAGAQLGSGSGEPRQGTAPRDATWNKDTGAGGARLMPPRTLRFAAAIGSAPACGKSSSEESFGVGTNSGGRWGGGAAAACGRAAWSSGIAYYRRPSPALSRRPVWIDTRRGWGFTVPSQEHSSHSGHGGWEQDGGTIVVTPRAPRTPARPQARSRQPATASQGRGLADARGHRTPPEMTPTGTGGADRRAGAPLGGRTRYSLQSYSFRGLTGYATRVRLVQIQWVAYDITEH